MKRLSSGAIAAITNCVLALVLAVVGAVCFLPSAKSVAGVNERVYYRGKSENGVSIMFNVYWGTSEVQSILDILEENGATATFFIGGSWADDNVDCVKEIVARGHEIGSHGYFHRDHSKLDYTANVQEIKTSADLLFEATGVKVTLFAPPSGAYGTAAVNAAEALGVKTVLWSKDTVDWRDKDKTLCIRRATKDVKGGELILMHPMAHTVEALNEILAYYRENGLKTVSVSENIGE